jgi:hypothetical protein
MILPDAAPSAAALRELLIVEAQFTRGTGHERAMRRKVWGAKSVTTCHAGAESRCASVRDGVPRSGVRGSLFTWVSGQGGAACPGRCEQALHDGGCRPMRSAASRGRSPRGWCRAKESAEGAAVRDGPAWPGMYNSRMSGQPAPRAAGDRQRLDRRWRWRALRPDCDQVLDKGFDRVRLTGADVHAAHGAGVFQAPEGREAGRG